MGSVLKVCGVWWVVGKPNLVKDFCPRLPLDLCFDFCFDFGLGQAFQFNVSTLVWASVCMCAIAIILALSTDTGEKPGPPLVSVNISNHLVDG